MLDMQVPYLRVDEHEEAGNFIALAQLEAIGCPCDPKAPRPEVLNWYELEHTTLRDIAKLMKRKGGPKLRHDFSSQEMAWRFKWVEKESWQDRLRDWWPF